MVLLSVPFVIILSRDGTLFSEKKKPTVLTVLTNLAVPAQSHYIKQKKTAVSRRQAFCMVLTAVDFIPSSQALSSLCPVEKMFNSSPPYTSNNQM